LTLTKRQSLDNTEKICFVGVPLPSASRSVFQPNLFAGEVAIVTGGES